MTVWVGIDPSLAGTAIALIDETGGVRVARCATDPTSTPAETVARHLRAMRALDLARVES